KQKGHTIVPSAPIVIKNDPTLMFTNAGMNQFKDFFLGNKTAQYKRVADTQKCLRVSGKHNDLEEVGVDTYHHTMFEMLGNWSFGDYFKKDAIAWSWELLTGVYGLPKDKLYVTVFGGDESEKLPKDQEAIDEWKKWIAEDRILLFGKKDNFWEMGDAGPCGPCTEIHVDCRSATAQISSPGRDLVNHDDPEVIEIWNNVFIQFNRMKDGSLESLPAKHVDTGMGLERLVRVMQNKTSNYDTDIFTGTINATEGMTGKKYGYTASRQDIAFRVISDHIRAIAFTIADGQLPSNTGAGYVIRRILRRAVRYYFSYLDYKQPLLCQLLPLLAHQFSNVFPELQQQVEFVTRVIREEEEAFLRTLDKGLVRFGSFTGSVQNNSVPGKFAFELYDTYGFPLDLTKLIAREHNLEVDEAGFDAEMQQQKQRSRAATATDTGDWIVVKEGAGKFVGYDQLETETTLLKYRKVTAKGKQLYQLVLAATPFYAESGGQVGDTGTITISSDQFAVSDTKKENDLIVHYVDRGPSNHEGKVYARVNEKRRRNTAWHHSATHLLHAALRKVLGTHVAQKGSLVTPDHLRFDFSHFSKLSDAEITEIEELVNQRIRDNIPVVIREMSRDEATKLGAMALFGEKYGEVVRVVIIDPAYSMELCGGTHVARTGDIGFFKIRSEAAVSAGVRRMEAVCGEAADLYVRSELNVLHQLKETMKFPADPAKAVESLLLENAELRKSIEKLEALSLQQTVQDLVGRSTSVNGISFIGEKVENAGTDALKKLCFDLKTRLERFAVVLVSSHDGKAYAAVLLDETVANERNLDAAKIIRELIAPLIRGGGGGQRTLATAGGQDSSSLDKVIDTVKSLLA
ncbi:MAG TPA: alanine--tRNA ligase, partial [Chitinophagaceae bacterium]